MTSLLRRRNFWTYIPSVSKIFSGKHISRKNLGNFLFGDIMMISRNDVTYRVLIVQKNSSGGKVFRARNFLIGQIFERRILIGRIFHVDDWRHSWSWRRFWDGGTFGHRFLCSRISNIEYCHVLLTSPPHDRRGKERGTPGGPSGYPRGAIQSAAPQPARIHWSATIWAEQPSAPASNP